MSQSTLIWIIVATMAVILPGCASTKRTANDRPERNFNAPSLTVSTASSPGEVLAAMPVESLMDRLKARDTQGRIIDYIAFTDTDTGGVVFVDGKLTGIVSRQKAQIFYICRGHTLSTPNHYWAENASLWVSSLLEHVQPANNVLLEFSGKTTVQSIKTATENPVLGRIKSILGMGTNPLSVFSTLNNARNDYEASEQFEQESEEMGRLDLGSNEKALAKIAQPSGVSFTSNGWLMIYPLHRIEYFIIDGTIQAIQQPALYPLARIQSGVFYAPEIQWKSCTAQEWPKAAPITSPAAPVQTSDQTPPPTPSPAP